MMEKKDNVLKETNNSEYRSHLFNLQFVINLVLIVLGGIFLYSENYFISELKWIRVIMAPAISGSFLIFLFFLSVEGTHNIENEYEKQDISKGILSVLISTLIVCILCDLLLSKHLERTVALGSLCLGVSFFFKMRYKNIYTMAIITGIVEGMILYFVFIYGTAFSFFS